MKLRTLALFLASLALAPIAPAASWPEKPIRIMVSEQNKWLEVIRAAGIKGE
jgi:hypothetical protein